MILQAHRGGSEGTTCKVSSVSDEVLEITINNSESKTPSGEANSGGEEGGGGEREGRGRGEGKGGEGGREERKEGGGGRCEEALPEEAKVVDTTEHSEEQTKRTMTDDNEQGLNCSTGGEQEVVERKTGEGEGGGEGGGGDGEGEGGGERGRRMNRSS